MKKIIIITLILLASSQTFAKTDQTDQDQIAISLGKIIIWDDKMERFSKIGRDPYSAEKHMLLIESEFKIIQKSYPIEKQIEFLWSIMAHSGFGSHYSIRFVELVHNCCHEEFLKEIDRYFKAGLKHDKTTLHKANFIKHFLENYK